MTPKEEYLLNCLKNITKMSSDSNIAKFADQAICISDEFTEEPSLTEEYNRLISELLECYCSKEPP